MRKPNGSTIYLATNLALLTSFRIAACSISVCVRANLSKGMARNCSSAAVDHNFEAGFVDMGIAPEESHTRFSKNPNTTVNAFIDFLFMMDATVIVSTGSSFSYAIAEMKGLRCSPLGAKGPVSFLGTMFICIESYC